MFEELKNYICNYVDVTPEEITMESRFIEDLGFNSFDFMSLLGELEDQFQVQVEDTAVLELHTVADAVQYLESIKE